MTRRLTPLLCCVLFAITSSGCSATLLRHRLRPVDGVIDSSDPEGVNVRIRGRLYRVPAEQIDDIDHPGNVLMVVGGVALGLGGGILVGSGLLGPRDQQVMLPGAFSYLGMGLGLVIGGGIPWALSRGAAMQYEYGEHSAKPTLPIACAPNAGSDFSLCPEPPPASDTLSAAVP